MISKHVVIIGSGISGLSAAFFEQEKGNKVTVLESAEKPGGVIISEKKNGYLLEKGPNTVMLKNIPTYTLIRQLGLTDKIIYPQPGAKIRYIYHHNQLSPIPASPLQLLRSPLLPPWYLPRILTEFFKSPLPHDRSVADFFTYRFGKKVYDNFVYPMVAGIYAGDPSKLSVQYSFPDLFEKEQKYGSVIKGFLKRQPEKLPFKKQIISFPDGLQTLVQKLSEKLSSSLHYVCHIISIKPDPQNHNQYRVEYKQNEKLYTLQAHKIIFALPPRKLVPLIQSLDSSLTSCLSTIYFAPLQILHLAIEKKHVGLTVPAFGFLKARLQKSALLGCIFNSRIFPHTAPEGKELFTVMSGGSLQSALTEWPEEDAILTIITELKKILRLQRSPEVLSFFRYKEAIPQYTLNSHHILLESVKKFETRYPGLYITGNFLKGVSVPDCIEYSHYIAQQ